MEKLHPKNRELPLRALQLKGKGDLRTGESATGFTVRHASLDSVRPEQNRGAGNEGELAQFLSSEPTLD
jgi:hypothetical protein